VRTFRRELWRQKNWLLHHDNAPSHTSVFTREFFYQKQHDWQKFESMWRGRLYSIAAPAVSTTSEDQRSRELWAVENFCSVPSPSLPRKVGPWSIAKEAQRNVRQPIPWGLSIVDKLETMYQYVYSANKDVFN
jgi:hypothetical protein